MTDFVFVTASWRNYNNNNIPLIFVGYIFVVDRHIVTMIKNEKNDNAKISQLEASDLF